jgi:hypothetical protein
LCVCWLVVWNSERLSLWRNVWLRERPCEYSHPNFLLCIVRWILALWVLSSEFLVVRSKMTSRGVIEESYWRLSFQFWHLEEEHRQVERERERSWDLFVRLVRQTSSMHDPLRPLTWGTDRLPSPTTRISSSVLRACRLGIQRKMAQAQQIWSIIL